MRFEGYTVKDMSTSEPIPEGTYKYRLAKFEYGDPSDPEWKPKHPNSQAKGRHLMLDLVVQDDGDQFGRHVFVPLSMEKGKDWLLRQLVEACGKDEDWELDTDELVDCEVMGVTIKRPAQGQYSESNNVKKFVSVFGEASPT